MTSAVEDLKTSLSTRIEGAERSINDRFKPMEEEAHVFETWKPKVDVTMEDLGGEIGALCKFVSRVVLDSTPALSTDIFAKPASTAASPTAGNPVDGPYVHSHNHHHRENVSGLVYTHTHSPVKG